MRTNNRWVIAIAGVFLQIALGAVYAWSVFRVPLAKQFGWSISEVTLTFTVSIFVLGFAAFFGGLWLNRKGPRVVALTGGALYGLGVFLASFSHSLWGELFNWAQSGMTAVRGSKPAAPPAIFQGSREIKSAGRTLRAWASLQMASSEGLCWARSSMPT